MKTIFGLALIVTGFFRLLQTNDLSEIRRLYGRANLSKDDAQLFCRLVQPVDSNAIPLLYCYKGAGEMLQAKYALNPVAKLKKFNLGKAWIAAAFNRDSLNLEMRFIRFSIQSNVPTFLGYRAELAGDKKFLLEHMDGCPDTALKKMVINYLTTSGELKPQDLKQPGN
jgi:hypothetical protein